MVVDRNPQNHLRLNLYGRLLPFIQAQDRLSGETGYTLHWDDPDAVWDSGKITDVWDALGLDPVIQELFWVVESLVGEDLQVLESLDTIVDPLKCPPELLNDLAASFGYKLQDGLDEKTKRIAILGLFDAAKSRGRRISFDVYYRLLGFKLLKITPLWKKSINEADNDYSTVRYATTQLTGATIGPSGLQSYAGRLTSVPIEPLSLRVHSGTVVLRDDGEGRLIGPSTESGTIDYASGDYTIVFAAATVAPVTADYGLVSEEWPYHAARMDLEISISPGGGPVPLVDSEFTGTLLSRLEEARPVHVLLRNFGIVVELADTVAGPTDDDAYADEADEDRDGVPSLGTAGVRRRHFLDLGLAATDDADISILVGGNLTKFYALFDDICGGAFVNDVLIIQAGPTTLFV